MHACTPDQAALEHTQDKARTHPLACPHAACPHSHPPPLCSLTFDDFCTALRLAAFRKQLPLERVVGRVVGCAGPALRDTTTPEAVRLYDDLSTWTGERWAVHGWCACV